MIKFSLGNTYERRPQRVKLEFDLTSHDRPPKNRGHELLQHQYVLYCNVSTTFWSNEAQLDRKTKDAERNIYAYMFKDILPLVQQIITDADNEETYKTACLIKDMLLTGGKKDEI